MAAVDSSQYEKFTIISVDGSKTVDISTGVVSFNYYEDLFSPMKTAMVLVANTGNVIEGQGGKMQSVYNGLPLRGCLLYTSPSPRDLWISRMPSSA